MATKHLYKKENSYHFVIIVKTSKSTIMLHYIGKEDNPPDKPLEEDLFHVSSFKTSREKKFKYMNNIYIPSI